MDDEKAQGFDMEQSLHVLAAVLDRHTTDTEIGRILQPGPTYRGVWARDTGVVTLGLNRLGKLGLSKELLLRYWSFQIMPDSDPDTFVFRNKGIAGWTDSDAFHPTREQLTAEVGAFPTSVYIQTPDFPAGTREIYTVRADLDSVAWLIIALHDQYVHSGDEGLLRDLAPSVARAIAYLCGRDIDGDHLLEQGPNEDWADILHRRGKVSYTQAVWFRCLQAAGDIFDAVGDQERARFCYDEQRSVRRAINRILMTPYGYYANYVSSDGSCLRRSLDTSLLVAFGVSGKEHGRRVLAALNTLDGPFGHAVIEPGYAPDAIGPSKYRPGQYQNEGSWPWITSYLALAWAEVGERQHAREIVRSLLERGGETTHEWIDGLTGDRHHADFATAAGAMAWVIAEAGLHT